MIPIAVVEYYKVLRCKQYKVGVMLTHVSPSLKDLLEQEGFTRIN